MKHVGASALLLLALTACPARTVKIRPYPAPDSDNLLARLAAKTAAVSVFAGETLMDYWLSDERVKGTVVLIAAAGARVHFQALSPADTTLVDMACDGVSFEYVNTDNNCQLTGPCSEESIARFLGVYLAPDDFFLLGAGSSPVLPDATATASWDASAGAERLELVAPSGQQSIWLDLREGRFDVKKSQLRTTTGDVIWTFENTDFGAVTDVQGTVHRLPDKARLRSPQNKADLVVEWKSRTVNGAAPPEKFDIRIAPGLPVCQ